MHILHTQRTVRLRAFAFLAAIMAGGWDCIAHAQQIANGIFNGNFEDGIVGWSKLGPGYDKVVLDSERHATANRVDAEFFIRSPRTDNKHFTVYSASVTGVVSGQSYPMRLRAKGNGEIVFGVMEFDEKNVRQDVPPHQIAHDNELSTGRNYRESEKFLFCHSFTPAF